MGESVKNNLFKPSNVVITCSSSGNLTSSLLVYWRDNRLLPSIGNKCLLLSDSWSAHNEMSLYDKVNCQNRHITRLQIPQKTANDLQALDVYYRVLLGYKFLHPKPNRLFFFCPDPNRTRILIPGPEPDRVSYTRTRTRPEYLYPDPNRTGLAIPGPEPDPNTYTRTRTGPDRHIFLKI
jgi:hypothetical protein